MDALVITPEDNVAIAIKEIRSGQKVKISNGTEVIALDDIPYSHKIALADIAEGQPVIKYGAEVAVSVSHIKQGMWVHVHNVR
jgi:altronate dehydratase